MTYRGIAIEDAKVLLYESCDATDGQGCQCGHFRNDAAEGIENGWLESLNTLENGSTVGLAQCTVALMEI